MACWRCAVTTRWHSIKSVLTSCKNTLATRRQAVAVVVQTGRTAADVAHWIADSTQIIDTLYGMAGVGMLPPEGNVYATPRARWCRMTLYLK